LGSDYLRQHLAQQPLQLKQIAADRIEDVQHELHETWQHFLWPESQQTKQQ
jgi:hypothetical protein